MKTDYELLLHTCSVNGSFNGAACGHHVIGGNTCGLPEGTKCVYKQQTIPKTITPVPVAQKKKVLEKHVEKSVKQYAKSKGWLTFKWSSINMRGVCDDIFIYNGNIIFIEFKRPGGKPTANQTRHHMLLSSHGMTVFLIDSKEEGKKIIDHERTKYITEGHHWAAIRKNNSPVIT